jgi:Tol biopolymer transport system component/DNA-binding winged helix-turn-helix (wHTH) protein
MSTLKESALFSYRFGDVVVDCANFRLEINGEIRSLTPRAFDLLIFFIEHRGRVIEKRELLEEVWRNTFVTDNALTKVIKELRRALGDEADSPRYIETVPRRGYRFVPNVQIIESSCMAVQLPEQGFETPEEHRVSPKSEIEPPATRLKSETANPYPARRGWFLITVITVIALALAAIVYKSISPPVPGVITAGNTSQITSWSGLDIYPALSPDGNSIAYTSERSGSFEIYVKQLAPGGRDIQVTAEGDNLQPTWSPDGKMIAFHSRRRGGIWLIPALGGVARRITDFGSRPAWSPDGSLIAFQSAGLTDLSPTGFTVPPSTIWVVPPGSGSPREITRQGSPEGGHASPSWSPDSKKIVFATYDIHIAEIWSTSMIDGSVTQLTWNQPLSFDPVFSPDGKSLYYSGASSMKSFYLWKVDLSPDTGKPIGKPLEIVNTGASVIRCPMFSADGKKLFYSLTNMTNNIWSIPISPVTDEATGSVVQLTKDTIFRKSFPSFSPDGRHVSYSLWMTGTNVDIMVMDSDGKNQRQLTTDPASESLASWMGDGKSVIAVSDREGRRGLWQISLDDGTAKWITDYTMIGPNPKASPDGKTIAFHARKGGVINLSVTDLDSSETRQLTFDKEMMGFPSWSSDGKMIALEMKRGEDTHIAIIPSGGGTATQLTFERGQSWTGSWSPDNDKIAFAGYRNGVWNVWWVSRDGKTQKQLTTFTTPRSYVRYPAWSPAGDQIVFEYAEVSGNVWSMELK